MRTIPWRNRGQGLDFFSSTKVLVILLLWAPKPWVDSGSRRRLPSSKVFVRPAASVSTFLASGLQSPGWWVMEEQALHPFISTFQPELLSTTKWPSLRLEISWEDATWSVSFSTIFSTIIRWNSSVKHTSSIHRNYFVSWEYKLFQRFGHLE